MKRESRIYVAGEGTLLGAAILRSLRKQGFEGLINQSAPGIDLTQAADVGSMFARFSPEYVFIAGGKSGGIRANVKFPADLMMDNLLIECNVIRSAFAHHTHRLLFLASSCSYPKHSAQPMQISSLLAGPLEPTNQSYAVAKIAGIQLCQAYRQQHGSEFIAAIPADAFGVGDDFSLEDSHVVAALIRKMHDARLTGQPVVELWGSGNPRREFVFADDLADASVFTMLRYEGSEPINLGCGIDTSIRELAELVKEVVKYEGIIKFDNTRPDGMPAKLLDSSVLAGMGWRARTDLKSALAATYEWYLTEAKSQ
jgi:GDP-L-fucose synthase